MAKTKRKWIILDWVVDGVLRAQDIPYDATDSIKDKIDALVSRWTRTGTTLSPSTSGDGIQVNDATIDDLATVADTVPISDANGKLEDTTVTITDAPSGGSILNLDEYATAPSSASLEIGDSYIVRVDATTVKYVFYDGTDTYAVEMSKE